MSSVILSPAAGEAATRNGYNGTTPAVEYPYSDAIIGNGVAVTLQQNQETLLAAMFLSGVTVVTKAVAIIEVLDHPCVLVLGTTNAGVELAASTSLFMPNCSVAANSIGSTAIALASSSSITAATLVTAGEIAVQGSPINPATPPSEFTLATPAMIGAPNVPDPYAGILTHSYLTADMRTGPHCTSTKSEGVKTYSSNCVVSGKRLTYSSIKLAENTQISGSWNILSNQTVDLSPGTYWVTDGDLTIESNGVLKCSACDSAKGTGVTIILTTTANTAGAVSMAPGSVFNLYAPSSGHFAGIVMAQDGSPSSGSSIIGAPGATLNGLVYLPNSSLTFHGNPSAAGPKCLLLVVGSLNVDANSSLDAGGCASAGLADLPVIYTVALAE
jgi:hypothetical protein